MDVVHHARSVDLGLPERTALPAVADPAFDRIAVLVRRVLHVPVALVSLVDRGGQVFPGAVGLGEPWATTRSTPLSHSFCRLVVAEAQPLVITDARVDPRVSDNPAIAELDVIGYAGMPLRDESGTVVGSLCAIDDRPHAWSADELAVLADLAATCSAELHLRSAAERAVRAAGRTRTLLELADALSGTTSVPDLTRQVAQLAVTRLGAQFGGLALLDDAGTVLRHVDLDAVAGGVPVDHPEVAVASELPSATVVRTRTPLYFGSRPELEAACPIAAAAARSTRCHAFAYVPLVVDGRVLGTVSMLWRRPRDFDVDDRGLIDGLARYTAQALHRAQLLAERRDVAQTLQAALLPVLPELPWVDLAGHYVAAHAADAVGGDWYDAVVLPDGTLSLAVGDVMGHDTAAAAAMGRWRATLHAVTVTGARRPGPALDALDQVMTLRPGERLATAVAGTVDPRPDGSATLTWANAGHLPPLLLAPGRAPELLERVPDRLLGVRGAVTRSTWSVDLPAGSTVLLFTDGLVEHRGTGIDDGLAALAYAADAHRDLPLAPMLSAITDAALARGRDDDAILFGLRLR